MTDHEKKVLIGFGLAVFVGIVMATLYVTKKSEVKAFRKKQMESGRQGRVSSIRKAMKGELKRGPGSAPVGAPAPSK